LKARSSGAVTSGAAAALGKFNCHKTEHKADVDTKGLVLDAISTERDIFPNNRPARATDKVDDIAKSIR